MFTKDKKSLALQDTDLMPFGKFKDKPMQDVPASYLMWLWDQDWLKDKYPQVHGYIFNNKDAIEMELKK